MSDDHGRPPGPAETEAPEPAPDGERQQVAEALERVRAGVRQRQSELATLGTGGEEAKLRLAELRAREYLEEPLCVSPRPVVGRFLVLARKAFLKLFGRWYSQPLLRQQNEFNRAASQAVQDLMAQQERLAAEVARLGRRLERSEQAGAESAEPPPATGGGR